MSLLHSHGMNTTRSSSSELAGKPENEQFNNFGEKAADRTTAEWAKLPHVQEQSPVHREVLNHQAALLAAVEEQKKKTSKVIVVSPDKKAEIPGNIQPKRDEDALTRQVHEQEDLRRPREDTSTLPISTPSPAIEPHVKIIYK